MKIAIVSEDFRSITGEAGDGFLERLARRGTQVHITSERDPHTAVELLLEDRLPACRCCSIEPCLSQTRQCSSEKIR